MSLYRTATTKSKGPFIAGQRLLRLVALIEKRRECLEPARFRRARLKRKPGVTPEAEMPHGSRWQPIRHSRPAFLTDADNKFKRLCLVVDAGVGKSSTMRQVQYLRSVLRSGHLALGYQFSELPEHEDDYLGVRGLLVREMKRVPELAEVNPTQLLGLLRRKIRQGELTLLADAIDQRGMGQGAIGTRERARALAAFLARYPSVSCVVSGRPKSIADCWDDLFEPEPFEFVQIDCFTETQAEEYVSEKKWAKVKQVGADFLSVPRMLEVIRDLKIEEIEGARTEAYLYWPAVEKSLDLMFEGYDGLMTREEAILLLSLVAIELHQREEEPIEGVEGADYDDFLRDVYEKRARAVSVTGRRPLRRYDTVEKFIHALQELGERNEGLACAVMDDSGEKQLYFRDMTLRDFFAALWCSRYATTDDIAWLRWRQHLWDAYGKHYLEGLRHGFWRLLSGMPPTEGRASCAWVHAVATLFVAPPGELVFRSTEMMHSAWPLLVKVADYEDAPTDPIAFDSWLQERVWGLVETGELPETNVDLMSRVPHEVARFTLECFLSEFPSLVLGRTGDAASQRVALELHYDGFGLPIEAGEFAMGQYDFTWREFDCQEPRHTAYIKAPYKLSRYPITNEQWQLFDSSGSREGRFYDKYELEDRCPASCVNWYDAWAAALWFHARLPSEQEWECACRGPIGDGSTPRREHLSLGFIDEFAKVGEYAWCVASQGYSHRPIPIEECWPGAVLSASRSPYQVEHLLGNVNQWTASITTRDPRDAPTNSTYTKALMRIVRGGPMDMWGAPCRAATRGSTEPSYCSYLLGIRVCRDG